MSEPARRMRKAKGGAQGLSPRARAVWGALLASMTLVAGGLLLLDRGPMPTGEGFSLPPLAALSGGGVESILETVEPIVPGRWQAIVIHDTGTSGATPESLDAEARAMGLRGLGYHFVLGNGNGMRNGQIHVSPRWLRQAVGAHAAGPRADWFNRNAIGICLVGNGERRPFTEEQIQRLVQLIEVLMRECRIPADRVYLHAEIADTPSPGRFFPQAGVRQQIGAMR
jgi:hypothetical protein